MSRLYKIVALLTLCAFMLAACDVSLPSMPWQKSKPAADDSSAEPTEPITDTDTLTDTNAVATGDATDEASEPTNTLKPTNTPKPTKDTPSPSPSPKPGLVADLDGINLTVGTAPGYPPMEYSNAETQQLEGFDIDMMREIGKLINANIIFREHDFDTILQALANNEYDLVVSSIPYHDSYKAVANLSAPYLTIGQVVVIQQDNPMSIENIGSLAQLERIGIQPDTVGHQALQNEGIPNEKIVSYAAIDRAFNDLSVGAIDAVVADGTLAAWYINQLPESMKVAGAAFATDTYAIAMAKDNDDVHKAINKAIKELKDNGTMGQLIEKWHLNGIASLP